MTLSWKVYIESVSSINGLNKLTIILYILYAKVLNFLPQE